MTATYPGDAHRAAHAADRRNPFVRAALAVEGATALDPLTRIYSRLSRTVAGSGGRRALLQGRWLGHAVHPLLVMVPLGTWTSVSLLDALGGPSNRDAARTLTGFGVLMAVPSAVTGLAEYADLNARDRRTASVHAVANGLGGLLYLRSWRARRAGRHARGAGLALAGFAAVGAGGFLGGHLTQARKVGSHHPAIADTP